MALDTRSPDWANSNPRRGVPLPEAHRDPQHPGGDFPYLELAAAAVAAHRSFDFPATPEADPNMSVTPENAPVARSGSDVDMIQNPIAGANPTGDAQPAMESENPQAPETRNSNAT